MPTLRELKDKWFLDVSIEDQFPPQTRHPGALVSSHTDGNLVEPLISGADMMAEFHRQVQAMIDSDDPNQYELWVGSWRIQPVKLLGMNSSVKDAQSFIIEAARAGINVYYLGSGHLPANSNATQFAKRVIAAGGHGASDKRLPLYGSHHQKFNIFRGPDNQWAATLGSGDFLFARWDTRDQLDVNPNRPPKGAPTHEASLKVQGPGVHDIALHFIERWNDPNNRKRTVPEITETINTDFINTPIPPMGPHSLQILRTYPIEPNNGYSWSTKGEFTIWASYLNAIKKASRYVYMEDQYFYTFQDPPLIDQPNNPLQEFDLVYQLGKALKRGVDVIVLVPSRKGNPFKHYELQQRRRAAQYLDQISSNTPGAGRFIICYLSKGTKDPTVHSKLMLVDDEFAIVGSANIGMRSMAYDSEVSLGVVDAENEFVRNLRIELWAQHAEIDNPNSLVDPKKAVTKFNKSAVNKTGRVRFFPKKAMSPHVPYRFIMNKIVDPYHGPPLK